MSCQEVHLEPGRHPCHVRQNLSSTEAGTARTSAASAPSLCRLSDGLGAAEEALDRLKVDLHDRGGHHFPNLTVAELAALFLCHVEADKGPDHVTFRGYKRNLTRLVERCGTLPVRKLHLTDGTEFKRWLREEARTKRTGRRAGQKIGKAKRGRPLGPVYINHHLRAAKAMLNWGVDAELLAKNPWRKVKLLPEDGRERIITDAEFQALLRHCTDAEFRQVLIILRYTAARPGELRKLTWPMVKWATHCCVIPTPQHKTGRTQKEKKPRTIPMPTVIERLLRWRQARSTGSPLVFPAEDGGRWGKDVFSRKFRRLRDRAGIPEKGGEQLVLYSHRHTRLTELGLALPAAILQQVAGHTTFAMTQRYLHNGDHQIADAVRIADDELRRRRQPK
jgi:integrase